MSNFLNTVTVWAEISNQANAETANNSISLSEELKEKFEKIFPSWPMMLATLIALILVIIIIYFLAHKPINKAIKARQKFIQDNIDSATNLKLQSQEQLNQANLKLAQAQEEAARIIQEGTNRSNKQALEMIEDARKTSKRMIEEARMDVKKQKEEFLDETRNQIAEVASQLSRQILKGSVNKDIEDEIINEFLKQDKF
ncbi:F0F1 ATP synthase subunit B [Mycoplasma sp. 1018B]|uniref:F0F1 ATP synthase subunit B n=1 Tax=Mycoplasma sp. 1018B TaxID=2967302 RepID=UPI00211C7198|nr:F0F1 ATP synthase subunit B [Mycoplasma sp. 1018B]UUM19104.1 F0F1 ATP synthase subunit B [Mycoplasma sp. 1018B]